MIQNEPKPIKIEMWDEDRGWIYSCENCGKSCSKNDELCPECHIEFIKTERV